MKLNIFLSVSFNFLTDEQKSLDSVDELPDIIQRAKYMMTTSAVSFSYNPFKTYWSLKFMNDLALTSLNLFGITNLQQNIHYLLSVQQTLPFH